MKPVVTFEGFKSAVQAQNFFDWWNNQGEQDYAVACESTDDDMLPYNEFTVGLRLAPSTSSQ